MAIVGRKYPVSFDENVLSDSFYKNYHFQKSFDYVADQIPVISNAEDDQNIVEEVALFNRAAGFIPDFAASISNDSKLVAPDFAQNSLLQNVQCPVPLHTNGNSSPLIYEWPHVLAAHPQWRSTCP